MYLLYTDNKYEGIQSVLGYVESITDAASIVDQINNAVAKYADEIDQITSDLFQTLQETFDTRYPQYKGVDLYQIKNESERGSVVSEYYKLQQELQNALPLEKRLAMQYDGSDVVGYSLLKKLDPGDLDNIC
jgi:t-SNARE complex subunit (syntaxin)